MKAKRHDYKKFRRDLAAFMREQRAYFERWRRNWLTTKKVGGENDD